MKDYIFLDKKYLLPLYPRRGITIVRGEGVYMYDNSGQKYLDMMSNYGVNILGYANKTINTAIINQLGKIADLHCSFTSDVRVTAAQKLIDISGMTDGQIYFSNSGTEAVEAALKFTILATGKTSFISMDNSYHGKTLGSLSMMTGSKYQKPFLPLLWDVKSVKFGNISSLKKAITKKIAAVILEPIQGEGGIHVPPNNYLKQVAEVCHNEGILLILDEIQAGCGRTGTFLASESAKISPNIICLGKGLAGGLPVGVTVVDSIVAPKIQRGIHSSTFGGNPLTCVGICATLDYFETHNILNHVSDMGKYFMKKLFAIKSDHIKVIRGKGLMIGVELDIPVTPILKKIQDDGVLTIPGGDMVVRFLPPYIIEKKHIDKVVEVLAKSLSF